jgi:hypothetical protein
MDIFEEAVKMAQEIIRLKDERGELLYALKRCRNELHEEVLAQSSMSIADSRVNEYDSIIWSAEQ